MRTPAETIERVVGASLVNRADFEFAHRGDFLPRKLAVNAISRAARRFPNAFPSVYNNLVLLPPYHWVGLGTDHVVISDGQKVLKIDRESRRMPPNLQEKRAQYWTDRYRQGLKVMNGYMLGQTVQVRPLPTARFTTACVTEQRYVNIVTDVAQPETENVLRDLHANEIPAVRIGNHLERFCEITEKAFSADGLTPDIGGKGNVVVSRDKGLTLLDSYLMDSEQRQSPLGWSSYATIEEHHRAVLGQLWERATELKTT